MLSGILLASHFSIPILLLPYIVLGFVLLFFIRLLLRKKLNSFPFFEIITILVFVGIGYGNYQLQQPHFQRNHYSNYSEENNTYIMQLKIKEVLKSTPYQEKYIAEIIQIKGYKSKGKVLLAFQKDSLNKLLKVDDLVWLQTTITTLPDPLNPYQFEYKKYMHHLGVYYQIAATNFEVYTVQEGASTLKGLAEKFRNHLIEKLSSTSLEKDERSIMEALILGQRRNIDPEIYKAYAAAGALHILAVSGLHVGIIFYLLSVLFSPLVHLKFGRYFRSFIIVISLWSFAFIAGFSPSVVRAVTMFSFFAVATMFNRPTNSFNILFLSFFGLLLYNPNWIFHVGFQLSYGAVFFILWLQPKLSKLYRPRFKIDKLFWDISTVTIAAQLGIAPLSVFYFHQFPGLFFITNLVILPFLSILLGYGIVVLLLSAFSWVPEPIVLGYNFLLKNLNQFVQWIAEKDHLLFQNLSLSLLELLGYYLVIITLILGWKEQNKKWIFPILGSIIFILVTSFYQKYFEKEELVIFHKSRKTWMTVASNDTLKIFQKDTLRIENEYPLKSYVIAERLKYTVNQKLPDVFSFQDQTYVVLDSLGIYPSKKGVIVVLTESPKVNLERLIDSIQPKLIIADGNNYKSYLIRWKKTCEMNDVPFYAISEKGAYVAN